MTSVEEFYKTPSNELLNLCSKNQLWEIVDRYELSGIDKRLRKDEAREVIRNKLGGLGILLIMSKEVMAGVNPVNPKSGTLVGLSFEQQKELIKMQQLHEKEMRDCELEIERRKLDDLMKLEGGLGSDRIDRPFDIINNLKLLPAFNERDPDVFFSLFESIADEREWPETDRTVMLQSVLVGKAQEAYTALSVEERKKYDSVNLSYRQRFRTWRKIERQTHMEVTRELSNHFDRCELREIMILEQLKNIVPDQIAVYINENKPCTAIEAASLADDFRVISDSMCRYCLEVGHWKNECPVLGSKQGRGKTKGSVPVLLTSCRLPAPSERCMGKWSGRQRNWSEMKNNTGYAPFISEGFVSLLKGQESVPVRVLRDTGSSESFILDSILPFTSSSYVGKNVLIRGIALQTLSVPLHKFILQSQLVNGEVTMGVRPSLPVEGVEIILGNNLAGESVWPVWTPSPIVIPSTFFDQGSGELVEDASCVVMCSKTKVLNENSHLCDIRVPVKSVAPGLSLLSEISREELVSAQKDDPGLKGLFADVLLPEDVESAASGYFIYDGVLLRKWLARREDCGGELLVQVVVPEKFRDVVFRLSHSAIVGHLGVKKTYDRVLQHFYWRLLKRDISRFIKTCHTCQVTGKPNQILKQAPLYPIPPVEKPFEHLLVDCVGPLPSSRSGSKFLLTVMCQSTRYPAAYAMRKITTRSVVIQSDRGTNFMSNMFAEILKQLGVQHHCFSAYHPQSQGVLELHQTLKSLLRAYCVELNRDWEEGLPWLLLAAREVTQSSLCFSPNELVFGHKVCGPLAVVGDQLKDRQPPKSLHEYVNGFRRRLFLAGKAARENLERVQIKMKKLFDRKSEQRVFNPGDQVLALLPLVSSPFCAKFGGPYTVVRALSELNYEIVTPDRKKRTQICHVNLLKPFFSRGCQQTDVKSSAVVSPVTEGQSQSSVGEKEGVMVLDDAVMQPRLKNSETLKDLERLLSHLSVLQRTELSKLIQKFPSLFGDVPSQTHLIEHDVDVGDVSPIRQRFYHVPFEKRLKLELEIQYMLENNIAKPSVSSWASPCYLWFRRLRGLFG
ncbi:hypothetical protein IRJ41_013806 [Triplophysa rosa]|uniref:Gypsy retrotransposon integrase-like protein 1 n=1 Tax=Triplophysa rosa TaxID=992332 RepID=A0A9W7TMG2_TRIRA|nr:hypothetical protein IRJ41_013806 [Triplophysa rosa]